MNKLRLFMTLALLGLPQSARASFLEGEALDKMADVMSWVAIVITPLIFIGLFWYVHILPEKIAHKRRHPQAKAIGTLCILSLFAGGLLWPIALIWATSRPVLYKLAYGTDVGDDDESAVAVMPQEISATVAPAATAANSKTLPSAQAADQAEGGSV